MSRNDKKKTPLKTEGRISSQCGAVAGVRPIRDKKSRRVPLLLRFWKPMEAVIPRFLVSSCRCRD